MMKFFRNKFSIRLIRFSRTVDVYRHIIRNEYIYNWKNWGRFTYFIAGLLSFVILTIEFGFFYPSEWQAPIRNIVTVLIFVLLSYEILAFIFTEETFINYFKAHKIEFFIIILVTLQLLFEEDILNMLGLKFIQAEQAGLIFLSITQLFFLFSNLSHLIRNTKFYGVKKINPFLLFVSSFFFIIVLGAILLHMPKMIKNEISSIDILFISASATCVTGLSPVNIAEIFTLRGQSIIMVLMQIGGLGIMTLASFFGIFFTGKTSVSDKLVMKDLLSEESLGQVKNLLTRITVFSLVIEGIGFLIMFYTLPENLYRGWEDRIFLALFHAISSFCNAGFSLFDNGYATPSLFRSEIFLSISMFLIVLGGLGFPVLSQIFDKTKNYTNPAVRLSVTTKLVLLTNLIMFSLGLIVFIFLEHNHSLKHLSVGDTIFHSVFYSVTMRTAGFNTLDMALIGESMAFFTLFFMWVGASPVSTGGGIKTTTFAIAILNIISEIRGKENVEIFKRSIAKASITRASATILLSFFVIFIGIFFLTLTEKASFLDLAFETVSAYATVGLSRGITTELSDWGKINLIFIMFMGRVGVFNLTLAIVRKSNSEKYKYPQEYVVVN